MLVAEDGDDLVVLEKSYTISSLAASRESFLSSASGRGAAALMSPVSRPPSETRDYLVSFVRGHDHFLEVPPQSRLSTKSVSP